MENRCRIWPFTTDRLIELVMKDSSDPFDLAITAIGMNDIVAGKNSEK